MKGDPNPNDNNDDDEKGEELQRLTTHVDGSALPKDPSSVTLPIDEQPKLNGEKNATNGKAKRGRPKVDIETEKLVDEEVNRMMKTMEINEDITCGYGIFKGSILQKLANKKAYLALYGFKGCIGAMTYSYFNGTLTTMEKRFRIPSRNLGIISVGNDISTLLVSATLSYYAGRGHRPRWMAFSMLTMVAFCILNALPHILYGPGETALQLTKEYGAQLDNSTGPVLQQTVMCRKDETGAVCEEGDGNLAPQIVLFISQFVSGIGGSLIHTLGVAYMDDNIKRSKTPALMSLTGCFRMIGPAIGYALSSYCLNIYISPSLTPIINTKDPRWLGAWWMGWFLLALLTTLVTFLISLFPRTLPRAYARKIAERKILKKPDTGPEVKEKASLGGMIATFKTLLKNKTYMCNNFAGIFYFFGYMPYWMFSPKYIEMQYRQSAATSNLVTGTVALGFTAIGVIASGFIISKFKPRARYMAAWNVLIGFLSAIGIFSYTFIGCPGNDQSIIVNIPDSASLTPTCNSGCHCDYVKYSPICGEDGFTYISPCHAGCLVDKKNPDGTKTYSNCGCIPRTGNFTPQFERLIGFLNETETENTNTLPPPITELPTTVLPTQTTFSSLGPSSTLAALLSPNEELFGGFAKTGSCPIDCFKQFVWFLSVMCVMKFIGSTGRATNFLVSVRCVPEKDKTAAMGFGAMMMSLLAFIPSPIFFGWLMDSYCLVWGKTCSNKGNCWLYDAESLRYSLNTLSSIFIFIGTLFDAGVWYYVKDLQVFDEKIKDDDLTEVEELEIRQKRKESIISFKG